MRKITIQVVVKRSQQDVFAFMSNPAHLHQWMPLMQSAAWTSNGEPGVGSTGRGLMKMAGKEMQLQLEVTRWDPPNQWGFKILNVQFPFAFTEYVYRLEPEEGATRVILDIEYEMVSLFRFAAGLMGKLYTKSNRNELNTAKQLLEAA